MVMIDTFPFHYLNILPSNLDYGTCSISFINFKPCKKIVELYSFISHCQFRHLFYYVTLDFDYGLLLSSLFSIHNFNPNLEHLLVT